MYLGLEKNISFQTEDTSFLNKLINGSVIKFDINNASFYGLVMSYNINFSENIKCITVIYNTINENTYKLSKPYQKIKTILDTQYGSIPVEIEFMEINNGIKR